VGAGGPDDGRGVYSAPNPLGELYVHFLDQRIILVSGKGGVGRTTTAVAMARAAAKAGRRTLLLEIAYEDGVQSALGQHFGQSRLSDKPIQISPNLLVCNLRARKGHEAFLRTILPGAVLIRAALSSRVMEKFLVAAPSMHEMGIFYHLMVLLGEKTQAGGAKYEMVVIDMPATGHTLALTSLPEILLRLIPGGPVAAALRDGQKILNDPKQAEAWVVTLPEQLPVTEACELVDGLVETHVHVGGILVNRMPEDPFTAAERAALDDFVAGGHYFGELSLNRIDNAKVAMARLNEHVSCTILALPDVATAAEPARALVDHFGEFMKEQAS